MSVNDNNLIYNQLIAAVISSNKKELDRILKSKPALINWRDQSGITLLMIAAMTGGDEIIDYLINKGASIDQTDENSNSALMYSISSTCAPAAAALIKNGANVYLKDNSGLNAAELARLYSQKKIADIIAAGKSGTKKIINARKEKYNNIKPLNNNYIYVSKEKQNINFLSGLFSLIFSIIKYGFIMCLILAAFGIYIEKTEKSNSISDGRPKKNKKSETPAYSNVHKKKAAHKMNANNFLIFQLINKADTKNAAALIEKSSFDINMTDESSKTLLMHAADKGYADITLLLIDKGANLEILDEIGNTALFYAVEKGFVGIVKLLIDKGANYEHENSSKIKPIIYAAKNGDCEILKILIEKGADVNAETSYRDTALTWAAYNGHYDAVKLLAASGANVNITTLHGDTPLTLARKQNHVKIAEMLELITK